MEMYDAIKAVRFPFPREAGVPQLAWALKVWLCSVAKAAFSGSCKQWAQTLLSQRYELLNDDEVGIIRGWEAYVAPARRSFADAVNAFPINEENKEVGRGRTLLERHAQDFLQKVQDIARRHGEDFRLNVFETELSSLAEDLANAWLGTAAVDPFLRHLAA